jgi:predicted HicB family RNase H-like nuclease
MTRSEVDKWLTEGQVELFDESVFQAPPEAQAESEPEATIYIRLPRALKDRIDAAAKAEDTSVNAWVMRCVERCMTIRPVA